MNDRLEIASRILAGLTSREYLFNDAPSDALRYADALIAAAGDGGVSEKPTSHSEPIKGRMGGSYYDYVLMEGERRVIAMNIKDGIYIVNDKKVTPLEFRTILLNAMDMLSSSTSEIPNNSEPVETIKSDWSLRKFFESERKRYALDIVILTIEEQDEICDLVEKHYKPSVPSAQEINKFLLNEGLEHNIDRARRMHKWLTERAKQ